MNEIFKRKQEEENPEIVFVIEDGDVVGVAVNGEMITYRVINIDKKTVFDYNPDVSNVDTDEYTKEILDDAKKHPKERVYTMYSLCEEDFRGVAKEKGLSITGKDIDEIARQCKKGIAWAVDDVWEEVIENAINETESEWNFEVIEFKDSEHEEHISGNYVEKKDEWKGKVEVTTPNSDYKKVFEFTHTKVVSSDNGGEDTEINTLRPEEISESDWDDLEYQMIDFVNEFFRKVR